MQEIREIKRGDFLFLVGHSRLMLGDFGSQHKGDKLSSTYMIRMLDSSTTRDLALKVPLHQLSQNLVTLNLSPTHPSPQQPDSYTHQRMPHRLPFYAVVLKTDPCIRHDSRYTTD